jgi:hypothetical protein
MPRRQLLSPQVRSSLFDPPRDPASIVRLHTLSLADLALVRRRRRPENRLGFAVQLAYLRHPGRAIEAGEAPPEALLAFIAQQLGVAPATFLDYARRDTTRREHFLELQAVLGLKTFGLGDYRSLSRWTLEVARRTDQGEAIVSAIVEEVRRRRIILPSPGVLERIGLSTRSRARAAAHADLVAGLTAEQREGLHRLSRSRRINPARASLGCGNGPRRPPPPISRGSSSGLRWCAPWRSRPRTLGASTKLVTRSSPVRRGR